MGSWDTHTHIIVIRLWARKTCFSHFVAAQLQRVKLMKVWNTGADICFTTFLKNICTWASLSRTSFISRISRYLEVELIFGNRYLQYAGHLLWAVSTPSTPGISNYFFVFLMIAGFICANAAIKPLGVIKGDRIHRLQVHLLCLVIYLMLS